MKKSGLFAELKRRNVLRAAAIYAAAVWALAQGVSQLAPTFGLPNWVTRWFVIACAIGFPFWIAFAWHYEWTSQGLKLESEIEGDVSIIRGSGRKLDYWIIAIMAVAIVLLLTNTFVLHRDATSMVDQANAKATAAALAKVPEKSVAVLPFANQSGDPRQTYFSDGLSEELITALTQLNGLKVIGKYSSFQFRDSKDSPAQIGAALGVANLIEGSVQQSGDQLRIMVEMIRTRDGSAVWSHAYDRPLKDVFAIQSEIGKSVAGALEIGLLGNTLIDQQKPPSSNVEAYQLMLQGRARGRLQTRAGCEQAIALLEKAIKLDPNYAYAWAVLSTTQINLGMYYLGGDARRQAITEARAALERANALAPNAIIVNTGLGYLLSEVDHDQAGALAELERALAEAPNDDTAMTFLAGQLSRMGRPQRAVKLYRKAIATDPLRADWYASLANALVQLDRVDAAEQAARKTVVLQPDNPGNYLYLSQILAARGKVDEAEQVARKALALQPGDPSSLLQLASVLDSRGHTDAAIQTVRKALSLQPDYPMAYAQLAVFDIRRNDPAAALRDAGKETNPDQKADAQALAEQVGGDRAVATSALKAYIDQYGGTQPLSVAEMYAVRKQPDAMFQWLQRGLAQHDANTITGLLPDTLLLPYHHDPRFAALCKKLDLPVPGQEPPTRPSRHI